jgi:phosphocarrier protein HPr
VATAVSVITIRQPEGWHARPATEFARIAGDSGLEVTIGRGGEASVRGDSVLSLLTLGARFGEELTITVTANTDAEAAALLDALVTQF